MICGIDEPDRILCKHQRINIYVSPNPGPIYRISSPLRASHGTSMTPPFRSLHSIPPPPLLTDPRYNPIIHPLLLLLPVPPTFLFIPEIPVQPDPLILIFFVPEVRGNEVAWGQGEVRGWVGEGGCGAAKGDDKSDQIGFVSNFKSRRWGDSR